MIHLVNMPFGQITHPSLALGLIQAQLDGANMNSRSFYLNLHLARIIGFEKYHAISMSNVQIGEWFFAGEAWENPPALIDPITFIQLHGLETPRDKKEREKIAGLQKIRLDVIPGFLEMSIEQLEKEGELRTIGFSCTFFQTLSSLALGRRIKKKHPGVKLVYGGAAFHGVMGRELIEKCKWIDAVSTGEADDIIVELFGALDKKEAPAGLQGVFYRDRNGDVRHGKPAKPVDKKTFEGLPPADFDDFFKTSAQFGILNDPGWRKRAVIPFETSRGCWWGQKSQCTFCGLNGNHMEHRQKSAMQVCDALVRHLEKYPVRSFVATDNNPAMSAFRELIPELKKKLNDVEICFSVKANLGREQIKSLAEAGVTSLGPGIESLSTHLLKRMRKGVNVLDNIFFLKCCREYGIHPRWNILMRVPGEEPGDYIEMEALIPKLFHLEPPFGHGKIQCHRFSPYFAERENLFAENIRPESWYEALFPSEEIDLSRVAYTFKADWKNVLDDNVYQGVMETISSWREIWTKKDEKPVLVAYSTGKENVSIKDTRTGELKIHRLDAVESFIYSAIADPAKAENIVSACSSQAGNITRTIIEKIVYSFEEKDLAIRENGWFLALAVIEDAARVTVENIEHS